MIFTVSLVLLEADALAEGEALGLADADALAEADGRLADAEALGLVVAGVLGRLVVEDPEGDALGLLEADGALLTLQLHSQPGTAAMLSPGTTHTAFSSETPTRPLVAATL